VEELFEARVPKGEAKISEIDGTITIIRDQGEQRKVRVTSTERYSDSYDLPAGMEPAVENDQWVEAGALLARPVGDAPIDTALVPEFTAKMAGRVIRDRGNALQVIYEEKDEREYP